MLILKYYSLQIFCLRISESNKTFLESLKWTGKIRSLFNSLCFYWTFLTELVLIFNFQETKKSDQAIEFLEFLERKDFSPKQNVRKGIIQGHFVSKWVFNDRKSTTQVPGWYSVLSRTVSTLDSRVKKAVPWKKRKLLCSLYFNLEKS